MNQRTKKNEKTTTLVSIGILSAAIVILQLISSFIKIGPFSITLAIVPIIIGAILYGPRAGFTLGVIFGIVVVYAVITGMDAGGHIMFELKPTITVMLCLLKGAIAGMVSGYVFNALKHKQTLGIYSACVICPVVNTFIFVVIMFTAFNELLKTWALQAGTESLITYAITGMIGLNFLVELAVDIILVRVVIRIIEFTKSRIS